MIFCIFVEGIKYFLWLCLDIVFKGIFLIKVMFRWCLWVYFIRGSILLLFLFFKIMVLILMELNFCFEVVLILVNMCFRFLVWVSCWNFFGFRLFRLILIWRMSYLCRGLVIMGNCDLLVVSIRCCKLFSEFRCFIRVKILCRIKGFLLVRWIFLMFKLMKVFLMW